MSAGLQQENACQHGGGREGEEGEAGGGKRHDMAIEEDSTAHHVESITQESEDGNFRGTAASMPHAKERAGDAKTRAEHAGHGGDDKRVNKGRSFITPHSLSPEEYSSALPKDPSAYTIGFERLDEIQSDHTSFVNSNGQEQLFFLTGNPSVQQYKGQVTMLATCCGLTYCQVRICKSNVDGSLSRERNTQLCILAVPMFMTIADFCRFLGPLMENILHMRIVHDDSRARYLVLMDFDSQRRHAMST